MNSKMVQKLVLWLLLCLAISFIFFRGFWQNITKLLSWSYLQTYGAYPWAVLFLCTLFIYVKRNELLEKAKTEELFSEPPFIFLGLAALITSLLLPKEVELSFGVFELLLASLGLFAIFFGKVIAIPAILLGVYGFTIAFPILFSRYMEVQYSLATVWMVTTTLKIFGFQLGSQGQVISFLDITGNKITAFVGAPSSGIASMTIFIALFVLMMLDIRLPGRNALYMLIFGLTGTTLQNVLRLVILVVAGYYRGPEAFWQAHDYAGYIIFPIWYGIFVYVYLRYAQGLKKFKEAV